eukprot:1297288-Lingulodinium_polyedra.AAC.1
MGSCPRQSARKREAQQLGRSLRCGWRARLRQGGALGHARIAVVGPCRLARKHCGSWPADTRPMQTPRPKKMNARALAR